jgi:Skp family chaperone for outer membrane proteins
MFKKYVLIACLVLIAGTARAEPLKIGIVDFGYIMTYANATKSINDQIDSKKEEFMAIDKEAQSAIVKRQQSLSEKKAVLPAAEFEKSRKELEEEIKMEQAKSRRNRVILENGVQEARKFLDKVVRKYIAKIAEDKGMDLVLPQEQVVISATELSITDEVLALVNKDLKEVKINFAKSSE